MHWIQKVWLHNFAIKKWNKIFFAFFMMQMNLTSLNIPLEVCKHISSTCLVGSLKLCRSTQIWDLMNSSHYNKNWKKIYIMHTSITSAHTVHFFLIENLQASTKSIIFKLIQYSTLLTEERNLLFYFYFYLQCITLLTQIVFETCIHKNKLMTMYGSRINIWRCPKPPGLYNK